jgi:hypothetical protein
VKHISVTLNASTSAGLVHTADTSGVLQLQTNSGTTALTISTAQNVGIGTASPVEKLQVKGNVRTDDPAGGSNHYEFGTDSTGGYIYTNQATAFQFWTNNAERMRIDSSGNLLIGNSSQLGSEKVGISQSANSQGLYVIATDSSTYATSVALLRGSRNTTNGTWSFLRCFNNGDKLFIYDSGNVVNANNSYGAISDVKLKENIVDATPKLEDLCKVKVRQYNLIGDNKKQIGVVAQELEEVFAGLVDESADKDEDGNNLGTTTKSVKYSVFVPMLVKAIQEQQTIINDLKARVETLEGAKLG